MLSRNSEIPHDVFFSIRTEEGPAIGRRKKIGAHKVLLSAVSPVFKRMFFGPMKETEEVIELNNTYGEAFKVLIGYIYGRHPDLVLDNITAEMQKATSVTSTLVLFFGSNCANFWSIDAQRLCNC